MSAHIPTALQLGTTVAKAILGISLGDPSIVLDATSDFSALFSNRTSDYFTRKAAGRRFEEIAERIAQSFDPILEIESQDLDVGERQAAIDLAISVLRQSGVSSRLLASHNLDPHQLARYVLELAPQGTRLLSEGSTQLYTRIVTESCAFIVDIASQLPSFDEHTFSEILNRQDKILQRVDQVLEQMDRIREETNLVSSQRAFASFEAKYRIAVARKLDEIQLLGTPSTDQIRRYPLSIAYVTLNASSNSTELTSTYDVVGSTDGSTESDFINHTPAAVDQFFASSDRLLLRGFAGSGKTTLLQWIAVRAARRTFDGVLRSWNDLVPFFIRLRSCVKTGLPQPETFPALVVPSIAGTAPLGWVHAQLEAGNAVLLIDGVDEVPSNKRDQVWEWIAELESAFPLCKFVVTSRPHAVHDRRASSMGFATAEIQPMDLKDVESFIDHWHEAVAEITPRDEHDELFNLANRLKSEIAKSHSLLRLATNPLLCALICTLHHFRREDLPSDRIELYTACCELLLERRESARSIDLPEYPNLTLRHKWVVIADFAYWMMRNSWSQVASDEADARLALKMDTLDGVDHDMSGESVRRYFVERTGLIREPILGQIDFTHRTFQEFLAARAAVYEGDIGLLVQHAHNDQWREVIILSAGLANKVARNQLVSGLIERGDKLTRGRQRLHLLAVACLETAFELDPAVKNQVRDRLSSVVPPKNLTEARDLASAGELAVRYLSSPDRPYRGPVAAACVRALSLIGSEQAVSALATYAGDGRQVVRQELMKAWSTSTTPEILGPKIVPGMFDSEDTIALISAPSFEGFERLGQLRSLQVHNCGRVSDLSPLASLAQLERLSLHALRAVPNLDMLRGLPNLAVLDLAGLESLVSVRGLANLAKAHRVSLSGLARLKTLEGVQGLNAVEYLRLTAIRQVEDLSLVGSLSDVNNLSLHGFSRAENLEFLSKLRRLSRLSLEMHPYNFVKDKKQMSGLRVAAADIFPLHLLPNITHLQLINSGDAVDLSAIQSMLQLTHFHLSDLGKATRLQPLTKSESITTLILSDLKPETDLRPIGQMISLQSLTISGRGQLVDLAFLRGLHKLETLELVGISDRTDLAVLGTIPSLKRLSLIGRGPILNISALAHLHELTDLRIRGFPKLDSARVLRSLKRLQVVEVPHDLTGAIAGEVNEVNKLPVSTSVEMPRTGSSWSTYDWLEVSGWLRRSVGYGEY